MAENNRVLLMLKEYMRTKLRWKDSHDTDILEDFYSREGLTWKDIHTLNLLEIKHYRLCSLSELPLAINHPDEDIREIVKARLEGKIVERKV